MLEEIIVTAEKRGESLQTIPIAISAFSADALDRAGVTGINDLKQLAPSLQVGESNNPNLSMRGVGVQVRDLGAESGVQVSENGVPWASSAFFNLDFLDVERVEVLRGPQGTISGRNATGGAINVYTARPDDELDGGVKLTVGNYARFGTEGYMSGPIGSSGILGRIAFRTERADGWLRNTFLDEDMEATDEQQLRVSFLAPLGDSIEAYLILEAQKVRTPEEIFASAGRRRPDVPTAAEAAGISLGDLEELEIEQTHSPKQDSETIKATLNVAWDISPDVRLASITGYGKLDSKFTNLELDGSALDAQLISSLRYNLFHLSQELTLTADLTDRLDMILGGMYMRSELEEPIDFAIPIFDLPPGSILLFPDQRLDSYAIYTQWRYRLTDNLRLALGGRYTRDSKSIFVENIFLGESSPLTGNDSWGAFTPRVALDYTPTDDLTLYASASRGYKAGGYDVFGSGDGSNADQFDPEFVWAYEAGVKWRHESIRAAFSAFYMDYNDFQARVERPGGPGGLTVLSVENAATATIKGVELELAAQVADGFRLTAAGTWLDASFDEFESVDPIFPELNDPVTGLRDLKGVRLPKSPEWQFNIGAEYTAHLGGDLQGIARVDYQWQDSQFFNLFNTPGSLQKSYGLLNLRASVETEDGSWQLAVFARNLLDERYFADLRDDGVVLSFLGPVGTPRTYGLSLAYEF